MDHIVSGSFNNCTHKGDSAMNRVIIIGCPGSGKTTFAKQLCKITGLPLYHLDAIWHRPDKSHIAREEFDQWLYGIFQAERWILDGNYDRTLELRLQQCDTVFFFDLPTDLCLQGALERLGKERWDLPWIDTELDPALKQTILDFPLRSLPRIQALLRQYEKGKKVIVFQSREDADAFLRSIREEILLS